MPFQPKTVFEPFRVKSVEPIHHTTRNERETALQQAHWNPFLLKANDVMIDLLTDSGTGAMSKQQWAGMMLGDESYAGATSFFKFEKVVKRITGFKHVLPTHQGRAAERILFGSLLKPKDIVPNNTHFDTTRANVEYRKAEALDILAPECHRSDYLHPFKGNIDLVALEKILLSQKRVPLVMITVTNNTGGGQPVSMENIKATSELCKRYGALFFLDACRFAENSYFIKLREDGYNDKTPLEIAQEMFHYADGCTMSAKKDGLSNIGGFLALNDDNLAQKTKNGLILSEGYVTYGGLAGYDLEAIAVGLEEVLQEDYLSYRIRSVQYLGNILTDNDIPIVLPPGGHAIYIDAKAMLPHIPACEYPAWALSLALYLEGGIRSVEIGSVMFGLCPDGTEKAAKNELGKPVFRYITLFCLSSFCCESNGILLCYYYTAVRLAFPRRVYTQSHLDYLAEVILYLDSIKSRIRGVQMVQSPTVLRHFTAKFEPMHGTLIEE